MKIELNAQELEAAVIAHLGNIGMDMKKKDVTFEFEGTCSVNIEEQVTPAKKTTTKRTPRAKAKTEEKAEEKEAPKQAKKAKPEPKAKAKEDTKSEPEEAKKEEEEVIPSEDKVTKPEVKKESAESLFGTSSSDNTDDSETGNDDEDTSLFG